MKRTPANAFTLIELLVVIAIIVMLLAILLPSMNKAVEISQRAVCASNLHQIGNATLAYAGSNYGELFPCRWRSIQIAFSNYDGAPGWRSSDASVDWIGGMATVGLVQSDPIDVGGGTMRRPPSDVWDCPSRDFKSQWETNSSPYDQIVVGYQYMGGIDTWRTFGGNFPSASPTNFRSAKNGWILAADATLRIDLSWGGGRPSAYGGMPNHSTPAAALPGYNQSLGENPPEGGNQVYIDGSVEWVPFREMVRIHCWNGADWNRQAFGKQSDYGNYVPAPNPFF